MAIPGASQNHHPHAFDPPVSGFLRDAVPILMRKSSTMTITEEDALIRHILTGTMPDGSPIGSGAKADAILARYVAGEVPSGLRRLVALGISKSARDVRRKGGRSHA